MVGALAAAAADSGSETPTGHMGGNDEMMRTSTGGALSARDGMLSRSVSMSLGHSLRESFGSSGNLRMSNPGTPHSPGDSVSVSTLGSKMRRSLEQYDQEDDLHSNNMLEDSPMLASLGSSSDFRRHSAGTKTTTTTTVGGGKPPGRVPGGSGGFGIAQAPAPLHVDSDSSHGGTVSLSSTLNGGSLMYSPSVSVSHTARSRYSAEDDDAEENSDLDDRRHQPPAKPAARQEREEDFRGRWSKHADETDASIEDRESGWAAAARPVDTSMQSFGGDEGADYGADAKGDGKLADSVDTFKREYRAGKSAQQQRDEGGFKGDMSVTESDDRFRNTGDYTAMSSIPTLNESVTSFDQDESYYKDRDLQARSLANTGHSDLTSTAESEGDVLHPRAAGRGRSNSRVQSFGDDEGSINSLALSDSNNLDD
jgi:hypothetical protein